MDLFLTPHKNFWPLYVGWLDFSFSDFALSALILPICLFACFYLATIKMKYYPGTLQNAMESAYESLHGIFYGYLGPKGVFYIPFLISLMLFIMVLNWGNLLPFCFPCTGELALTLSLGIMVFSLIVFIGFYEHGLKFFNFFIPHGVPTLLKPFLFVLELFSFLIRPISLALRLCINMIAGHVMLGVIASFGKGFVGYKIISIAISSILGIFELGVACLQAYVFAVLSCIYIADILNGH